MLIPSQIVLTYVRPSFWLPGLEILWGFFTGLMAMITSAKQVYVLRVFLGLCESGAWPGMITLFSRLCIFECMYIWELMSEQCTGTRPPNSLNEWASTIPVRLSGR